MQIVDVRGEARNRGRLHGEACRAAIAEVLYRFEARWPARVRRELIEGTGFVAAAGTHASDLLDEVRGIAEGSDVACERLLALNLMDEIWMVGASGLEHCSAVAIAGDGRRPALVAQTIDLPADYDGAQTLLRTAANDVSAASLVLTIAGMVGLCGLNEAGVAVAVTSIPQLHSSRAGLGVSFVVRRLLDQRSAADAVAVCRRVPHAVGQSYLIGDSSTVTALEASARSVVDVVPDRPGLVCHTNHALANCDRASTQDPRVDLTADNSGPRLAYLRRQLAQVEAPSSADLRGLLASREAPISREKGDADDGFTFAAVVMELGASPVLHVAPGPPSRVPFATPFVF